MIVNILCTYCFAADKNKEDLLASGHIKEIVSILKDETQLDMPLYTRKALGTAISHLAIIPHLR